ncbi:hypothetical protein OG257_17930 [Streptomyces sp. NBC_00683]|uniref:hypothetical protein n=1 Tax=Streptomyces sp. NBC_00683 TaxID=2903670 RepID=UPI002E356DF2|nr:hypothetical protein [Streptomyces sp. NBC_00683]
MSELLPLLVLAGAVAGVMGFFTWLASRVRRRGVAGAAISAAMASYDEAFRVTAHDAHYEIQAQAERKVPVLSPGSPWGRRRGEGPGDGGPQASPARPRRPRRGIRRRVGRLWRGR